MSGLVDIQDPLIEVTVTRENDMPADLRVDEAFAREQDADDPLGGLRGQFHIPLMPDCTEFVYLCGHSLGLQPKSTRGLIEQELDDWARLGVEGHFRGARPWYAYHEQFRELAARLIGGLPGEAVVMNSLSVNLHLMLTSFYRPTPARHKILIDAPTFPSDLYAVQSQLTLHGYDPAEALLSIGPRAGALKMEDVESLLEQRGQEIAVIVWNGVNFATGQWYDLPRLTRAAQRQGCLVGLDLAHAAGNVPLALHDWQVDFAVWCSYKYLNSGPGAVAGCFVHERHGSRVDLPRLAGWWGNDPATRFDMPERFLPRAGADGWQISNPPILALAPVLASLRIFDELGMNALRARSLRLTGYLHYLLGEVLKETVEVLTPTDPEQRGCQLSLRVPGSGRELVQALHERGVLCDFRPPDVIRAAPVPLYNTFHDVWRFVDVLASLLAAR